jgi:UDP-N-acetylglucosamine 2-epimerase (non-hydrolysing)
VKVFVVFGTRPEAIKLAPVIRELESRPPSAGLRTVVCVTGQHREMLDQVLSLSRIEPDYDLDVMERDQTPSMVAAAVLSGLEPLLAEESPDWVVVQGDTTTVAAAGLAAYYARSKVAHVEAGLRTHDKWQPFPEELNRRFASVVADLHFAPTDWARRNLLREGTPDHAIVLTGNPVIDALLYTAALPPSAEAEAILGSPAAAGAEPHPTLILVTAHRRENFGPGIEGICLALKDIAHLYGGACRILYSVHPNPKAYEPARRLLQDEPRITLLPPQDYLTLVHLMKRSDLVLTDSGGIQEEAPSFGKPVLVLREVTERPEAVQAGTVKVVGTSRERIVAEVTALMEDRAAYEKMARAINPYGDGQASRRIVSALLGEPVDPFSPADGLSC